MGKKVSSGVAASGKGKPGTLGLERWSGRGMTPYPDSQEFPPSVSVCDHVTRHLKEKRRRHVERVRAQGLKKLDFSISLKSGPQHTFPNFNGCVCIRNKNRTLPAVANPGAF